MTDYFLHVDLVVLQKNVDQFEKLTGEFLSENAFRRFDPNFAYTMVLALRDPPPDAHAGKKDNEPVHYVHLWQVPNTTDLDLASVMTRSADDPLYQSIDALVDMETQNFVALGPNTAAGHPLAGGGTNFIRVTRQFTQATLTPYLFNLGIVGPILRNRQEAAKRAHTPDWYSLGAFQSVTGTLNTVTEFWQTHHADTKVAAFNTGLSFLGDQLLAKVEPLKVAPTSERRELFQLAKYFR